METTDQKTIVKRIAKAWMNERDEMRRLAAYPQNKGTG